MKRRIPAIFALTAAAVFAAMPAAAVFAAMPAAAQQEWSWEGSVTQGQEVEIKGVNGNVTATLASGDLVVVNATKEAKRGDPSEVTIEVVEHAGGVTICAVYPTPPGKERNECRPGNEGHMSVRDNDTFVNFRVQLPAGVAFRVATVNGNVAATGLRSDVRAHTVNGNVEVSTSSSAEAHTVNGSIEADLGQVGSGDLSFHTVNGGIEIGLPEDAGVRLQAETVNGDFDTEFSVTIEGNLSTRRWGPKKIQGLIGGGGPRLELKTVNGSIRLRKS